MIRSLFWLVVIVALFVVCVTVPFGDKTMYGHISAIWHTKEAQDAKKGIEQKFDEVRHDVGTPGSGSASASGTAAHPSKW